MLFQIIGRSNLGKTYYAQAIAAAKGIPWLSCGKILSFLSENRGSGPDYSYRVAPSGEVIFETGQAGLDSEIQRSKMLSGMDRAAALSLITSTLEKLLQTLPDLVVDTHLPLNLSPTKLCLVTASDEVRRQRAKSFPNAGGGETSRDAHGYTRDDFVSLDYSVVDVCRDDRKTNLASILTALNDRPPAIDLIIPTKGRFQLLQRTLQTIEHIGHGCRTIVVDDSGEDKVRKLCHDRKLTYLRTPAGRSGPSAARNLGLKEGDGDLLIFLDDDIIVSRELLTASIKAHKRHMSLITGCYRSSETGEGTKAYSKDSRARWFDTSGAPQHAIPMLWSIMYGFFLAIRRDSISVGFDEHFQGWGCEDVDFVYSNMKANHSLRPIILQRHSALHQYHTRTMSAERIAALQRNIRHFCKKHHDAHAEQYSKIVTVLGEAKGDFFTYFDQANSRLATSSPADGWVLDQIANN
ncbi:glycosyltransferase family 2 protein [Rhizobium leguminosarum]|uniref:glycosyltransferase family 2 protein n=1 Tax=Rhizobium leguminosarum TaxID=384 RepID=UPI0004195307|nr:glycosyltransferase family 2 protein [Rhizobium leguminosarum]